MKKNILIVDDDKDIALCLADHLSSLDYHALTSHNVNDAFKILSETKVDLILSDIKMPQKTGLDFYVDYQSMPKENTAKFVLMTGHTDILTAENAFSIGIDELIAKPFELDSISLVIDYLLDSNRAVASHNLEFIPIQISDFIISKKSDYDIYLKIADKYIKVTKAGQEFIEQRLNNLLKKGVTQIYLTSNDFAKYIDLQFAISNILHKKPMEEAKKIKVMNQLLSSVSKNTVLNSINHKVLTQSISALENYTQIAMRHSQLNNIIDIMANENPTLAEQSALKAIMTSAIANMWRWNTPKIQSRIILAALLADIGLRNKADLIKKKRFEYTADEIKMYEQHPLESYEILRQIENIPEEILLVAIQHHENPTGLGFPQKLPRSKIHPFSKLVHGVGVFIDTVYGSPTKLDNESALESIRKNQAKTISEQVLKSLYLLFNLDVPDSLKPLLLPTDTSRVL